MGGREEMKPDWSTAPDFARYLAQDADGTWIWFENKPEPRSHTWAACGNWKEAAKVIPDWLLTREKRPVHNEAEGK
jgi:hypothetical protein